MTVQKQIETKLATSLSPAHLEVVDESHMHSVPPGSESHFRVVVVSDAFEDLPLVRRHRRVNEILAEELRESIHALSMQTLTQTEWTDRGGETLASPPCLGGGKTEA